MRSLIIITLFFIGFVFQAQAQQEQQQSKQTKTIEINNDNGDLVISFVNDKIEKFEVNGETIPEEQYSDYQTIIDDFSGEVNIPEPPQVPEPPIVDDNKSGRLYTEITDYLASQEIINTDKKFKIQLKKEFLKVGGKKLDSDTHDICLEIFEEIYSHALNSKSQVKFKKGRRNYHSSMIRIIE